jgi:hypothetical protein
MANTSGSGRVGVCIPTAVASNPDVECIGLLDMTKSQARVPPH